MAYKYVQEKENYEDLASGRVLYNAPGATAFPVRLASELFLRAWARLADKGGKPLLSLYDPCCGSGYLLTVLGILHGDRLARITGSDVDERMLALAGKNLALLHATGLDRRMAELRSLHEQFGKDSHAEAIESAGRIKEQIVARGRDIPVEWFQADATKGKVTDHLARPVDVVMTDVPYGNLTAWQGGADDPAVRLLEYLLPGLGKEAVVVLVADKRARIAHIAHPAYRRLERLDIGKRQAVMLEPAGHFTRAKET